MNATLEAEAQAEYVATAVRLLRGARLGRQWPDARRLADHLEAMGPAVHQGLYPRLAVEAASGLPGFVRWQQVLSDVALAADGLAQLGSEERLAAQAQARGLPVDHKQLARRRYYDALVGRRLSRLDAVEVRVRRIEGDTAWLNLVLDKLETNGRWLRLTVDVAQRGARGLVRVEDELAEVTEGLRGLIFRAASLDVELLWVTLADQPDLEVEQVVKGAVGPLWARGLNWPAAWAGLEGVGPTLCATLAIASPELAADSDRDPLVPPTAPLRAARARYGFRVSRERRFVVRRGEERAVSAWCRAQGTPCVVRGAR